MLQGKYYRFTLSDLGAWNALKSALRKIKPWVISLVDALPPYYTLEGVLESKKVYDDAYILIVNGAPISVDRPTYHILDIGERIRVRYTRGARAINIDRFLSENSH